MKSRQNLKGSVLFTVVAVMMVVLVFVMSALTIAGATSRRAYSDYAKAQTQYTARSAIDATITYLQDSTEFARKVKTLNNAGDSFDVTVSYEASDGSTDDITVNVELVAKGYEYTDGETHDVVTLTASSSLLDENSSVSLFLLKDSPGSSSGGFSNALTTLGSFNPRSGKITSYGGTSVNLNVDDGLNPSADPMKITESNGAAYSGNLIFNSSIKVADGKPVFRFDKDIYGSPQGVVIYGDFDLDGTQSEAKFVSEVDYSSVASVEYSEIPYIFVDGTFDLSDGVTEIGSANSGFNIFCKQFLYGSQNNRQVYADTYIWNADPDYSSLIQKFKDYNDFAYDYYNYTGERGRNYTRFYGDMFTGNYSYSFNENNKFVSKIGNDGGTQLLQWAGSIVNGETNKEYGGNIFTKGSLCFGGQSTINGDVTAEQGVYMSNRKTNPWGWEMKEAVRINGKLTVGGVLFIDNDGRNSYVESLCISSPDSVIIRGRGLQVGDKVYNTTEEFINACNITDPADPNYNPNIIVDASQTTGTFPEKMTRDEVLKFVSTKQAAVTQHQDPSTGEYSQLKHRSDFSAAELIQYRTPRNGLIERTDAGGTTNFNRSVTITDSCTLSGDIMGAEITFDAAAGSKLYVILDNVNVIQQSKFYVNSNGGDVYFFCDSSCSFDSGGLLITTNYKDALENHQPIDILQSPGDLVLLAKQHLKNCNVCADEDDAKAHIIAYHKSNCCSLGCSSDEDVENHLKEARKWMPNVYFYMDKRTDGSNSSLYMGNNTLMTAYLYAPYTNILLQDTKDMEITYDGEPIRTRLSVIGSTVAADVNTYANEEAFIFIDPSGSSEGISDADGGTWFPMYYQNSSDVA